MKRKILSLALLLGVSLHNYGQMNKPNARNVPILRKADYFPKLEFTKINGAPRLGKPELVMGNSKPAISEGMGWAAPAFYDWDGDDKKDLLIGEFLSGSESGHILGNFIRVYKNIGTADLPKFSDDFTYASYPFHSPSRDYPKHLPNYGTPISILQGCCMAFKPQFEDLNGDGFLDLYCGNYHQGQVFWFRGFDQGFFPGEEIEQYGANAKRKPDQGDENDPNNWRYWTYSAVSFGEFTGDDLPDAIVGGQSLRISKNIGTKTEPKLGLREVLLDSEGNALWNNEWGAMGLIPYVIDWDQDGILDLLVSGSYSYPRNNAVMFFKGKQKGSKLFEKGIPLFVAEGKGKALPGDYLNVSVGDWNNDGINDLIIGTKVALIDGKFDLNLNWFEYGTETCKLNPGYLSAQKHKEIEAKIHNSVKLEKELGRMEFLKRKKATGPLAEVNKYQTKEEIVKQYYGGNKAYKTLIHQGYVYVMLGEK